VLLLALAAFVVWRREALVFALGVGGLLVFQSFFYGGPHHEGAIVVAIIASLWIAYPDPHETMPSWFRPAALAVLCGIFAIQTFWAVRAWRSDFVAPYSGASDMASFLRKVAVHRGQISGFAFYSVAIQPYFDRNIFSNWPTAYVHHSQDAEPPLGKLRDDNLTEYLLIPSISGDFDPTSEQLFRHGYIRLHVSPGRVLDRHGVWMTETFTLYRRLPGSVSPAPPTEPPSIAAR